jgi:hypothetical protein
MFTIGTLVQGATGCIFEGLRVESWDVFESSYIFGMLDQHNLGIMVALLYDTKAQFLERKKRY